VTLKTSSSTDEQDIEGDIGISKSGSNGFSYSDTKTSVSLTASFDSVGSGDQDIPTSPMLFSAGNGFVAEKDHIFTFADDDDSYFEVSTTNQKDIVLAFDTDWDDELGDEILDKYPDADLDFYNGNYAKFSKTGTLYLANSNDDAYVYEISSSGKLTRVDAEYDDYEEAYVITTNTLGRYVISTMKISLSSSSSSSSSSSASASVSSASSASTVTAASSTTTTASTSTSTSTTPASSSTAPASSSTQTSTKPSSSSTPSSSTSSSSSSKESESSEPLSVVESSSEADDTFDNVIVSTDTDDDIPTKSGGVSWIVWLLILAGLIAVLVAVGVIFYTKKNSGRRML
jgi:hypothetical protein